MNDSFTVNWFAFFLGVAAYYVGMFFYQWFKNRNKVTKEPTDNDLFCFIAMHPCTTCKYHESIQDHSGMTSKNNDICKNSKFSIKQVDIITGKIQETFQECKYVRKDSGPCYRHMSWEPKE